jgi:hypothetical protein
MSCDCKYISWNRAIVIASVAFAVLLFTGACSKDKCLKSIGKVTTEERPLADFGKIMLSDDINVYIRQDSVNRVVVEAGANLIPWIITKVEDRVLTIRDDNKCNWLRSFKRKINLYLFCRELYNIEYYGAGEVRGLNTIVSDSVEIHSANGSGSITLDVNCRVLHVNMHTGPADAEVSGTAQWATYYTRGNGRIVCDKLVTGYAYIDAKGTNDSYVYSNYQLGAKIGYIGNVFYAGHPSIINSEVTERGQLIPID